MNSISALREQLLGRLRSRGADRLLLKEVARRCGLEVLGIEAFLSGARLPPAALATCRYC
jgi:hypothetical protein